MKRLLLPLSIAPLAACISTQPAAPPVEGQRMAFTLTGGEGSSPGAENTEFDNPWAVGMQLTVEQDDWPVGAEVGLQLGSANGSTDTEHRDLDLSDVTFGVTKQWEVIPHICLVVGGGLRIANATLLGPGWLFGTELDDDYSLGYYAHAGAWWMFHKNIGVGLDARHADGSDFRLAGESVDSRSAQLLLGLRLAF